MLHARTGLFFSPVDTATVLEANRLNGVQQRQMEIYSPVYGQPLTTGAASVTTVRAPLPSLSQTPSLQSHLGVEHEFTGHWHAQANLYLVRGWDLLRSRNINAPLDGQPSGPRPLLLNTNIDQYQQTGNDPRQRDVPGHRSAQPAPRADLRRLHPHGSAHEWRILRAPIRRAVPATQAKRHVRPGWQRTTPSRSQPSRCPKGLALSTQFDAASGNPYNVTTGFDANGDGILNDRPHYATGTESTIYRTAFGALAATGTGQYIQRNAGTLPWNIHLDANLSRSFALPHRDSADVTSLAVNVRSTNLLNHTNATRGWRRAWIAAVWPRVCGGSRPTR